jgi:hypothetical protein
MNAPLSPEERAKRAVALTVAETDRPRAPLSPAQIARVVEAAEPPEQVEEAAEARPITVMPAAERLIAAGAAPDMWMTGTNGLVRWRPMSDHLDVVALPGGWRVLSVNGYRLKLSPEAADHLAELLRSRPKQATAEAAAVPLVGALA